MSCQTPTTSLRTRECSCVPDTCPPSARGDSTSGHSALAFRLRASALHPPQLAVRLDRRRHTFVCTGLDLFVALLELLGCFVDLVCGIFSGGWILGGAVVSCVVCHDRLVVVRRVVPARVARLVVVVGLRSVRPSCSRNLGNTSDSSSLT